MNERAPLDAGDATSPSPADASPVGRGGVVTLDVRDDLRNGREPFTRIMKTVAGLRDDERLRLIAPFEPVPLYHLLARQGFRHSTQRTPSGDWAILFARGAGAAAPEPAPAPTAADAKARTLEAEVDARGLEPPQPLVKILEALAALPAGADLKARTDLRPMHLYAQLESRGFHGQTEEQPDGGFITHIRRH